MPDITDNSLIRTETWNTYFSDFYFTKYRLKIKDFWIEKELETSLISQAMSHLGRY